MKKINEATLQFVVVETLLVSSEDEAAETTSTSCTLDGDFFILLTNLFLLSRRFVSASPVRFTAPTAFATKARLTARCGAVWRVREGGGFGGAS